MKKTAKSKRSSVGHVEVSRLEIDRIQACCLTVLWSLTGGPKPYDTVAKTLSADIRHFVIDGAIAHGLISATRSSPVKIGLTASGRGLAERLNV